MAQQNINPETLGLKPLGTTAPVAGTLALSATTTWLGFGFIPSSSDSVTSVRVNITAVSGTLATTDCTCDIYSDGPGHPNASLGSVSLGSAPTGAGWVTFTFGTPVSVTAGTQYWVVLKNANGTPGTNFPTYGWITSTRGSPLGGVINAAVSAGWVKMQWNGTSWSTLAVAAGWRIGYNSGAYQGQPYATVAASTLHVQGGATPNEEGVKLTLPGPSSLLYNFAGIGMEVLSNSTPTGKPQFNLYIGSSTLTPNATTGTWLNVIQTTVINGFYYCYFSSTQQVPGGSVIRITLADSATDISSNYYNLGVLLGADTDSNSLPLAPFQGTAIYTKLSGGGWTDDNAHVPTFAILLDTTGEFSVLATSYLGGPQQTLVYWDG